MSAPLGPKQGTERPKGHKKKQIVDNGPAQEVSCPECAPTEQSSLGIGDLRAKPMNCIGYNFQRQFLFVNRIRFVARPKIEDMP